MDVRECAKKYRLWRYVGYITVGSGLEVIDEISLQETVSQCDGSFGEAVQTEHPSSKMNKNSNRMAR